MKHSCDAIVVSCIDFRFQKTLRKWLDFNFKNKTYDYLGFAGATKELGIILDQINVSAKLHSIKEVYLINHEDCGAYGLDGTPERHKEDLLNANREIHSILPHLKVHPYYLHLNGNLESIE